MPTDWATHLDVGGHKLYLRCSGAGRPVVLLETGLGVASETPELGWSTVQTQAARFTRVCSYDRANLGRSDRAPSQPRTCKTSVEELHALVEKAALPKPFVYVGHSVGGWMARIYHQRFPNDVAGMVLVEAAHEAFDRAMERALTPEQNAWMRAADEENAEGLDLDRCREEVRQAVSLGDVPLISIVGALPAPLPSSFPGTYPHEILQPLWMTFHTAVVAVLREQRADRDQE